MATPNRPLCKVPIFRRDPVPPASLLQILDAEPQNLHHQDLHIYQRGCCGRVDLCTLYIPLTPSSDVERLEAQERQATSGAATMDVEPHDAERGRRRESGVPDVVITLPSRITLKLLPREDLGYKLITATGVLIDLERPSGGPENGQEGGKGEEVCGRKALEVDQVLDLELSLVSGELVGATDVYCSVCSTWVDRHLGLVPGCY